MNRPTPITTGLVLSLLLAATVVAAPPKTYTLAPKYIPGVYYMVMNMDMQQKQGARPAEEENKPARKAMNMEQVFVVKMVISQPDENGQKTMTITYERIGQTMKMGNVAMMRYDSLASQSNGMMAQMFAPLLKAKITAVLDKDHTITSVSGFEGIWDELIQSTPSARPMLEKMKGSFNDENLRRMIETGQEQLPAKPVAVGESWTNEQELPMPMFGKINVKSNMKLLSVEEKDGRQIAKISISGAAKAGGEKAPAESPIPMKITEMDIQQKGTMFFDITAGQMSRTDMKQTISMAMSMANPQNPDAPPMAMNMEMDSDITMNMYMNEEPPEMTPPATTPASAPAEE